MLINEKYTRNSSSTSNFRDFYSFYHKLELKKLTKNKFMIHIIDVNNLS